MQQLEAIATADGGWRRRIQSEEDEQKYIISNYSISTMPLIIIIHKDGHDMPKIIWFTLFEMEIEMCQSQKRGSTHSPGTIQGPQCQARKARWRSAANIMQVPSSLALLCLTEAL
jgi:hypothetical protein